MSAVSNCFQRRALEKVVLKRGLAGNGLTDGRLLFVRLCLSNSLTITSLGPALVRLWLFIFQVNSYKEFKKKIVGHFKKHRRNCENCQSQVTWKVKFKWEFCPVLSCPVLTPWPPWPPCLPRPTWPPWPWQPWSWKLEVIWWSWRLYTRKLEVVWSHLTPKKEVGGYLES